MIHSPPYLILSILVAVLILISGGIGIGNPAVYEFEAFAWQIQAVWQDYADVVLVVPVLLIAGAYAHFKSEIGKFVWAGTLLYLVYTYLIFCFAVHFNMLFIFYCLILGASFYSLAWFFYANVINQSTDKVFTVRRSLVTATYFIVIGVGFYLIWLAQLVPPMLFGLLPPDIEKYQLPVNPVHVIDIAFILPAFILTGIMIYTNRGIWHLLSPVLLIFGALMSATIGGLQVLLYVRHFQGNMMVASCMLLMMLADIVLFITGFQRKKVPDPASQQILRSTTNAGF